MLFQKAELCSAAISGVVPTPTFPDDGQAPAGWRPPRFARAALAASAILAAIASPRWLAEHAGVALARVALALSFASSIVLEAAPFIVSGVVIAALVSRFVRNGLIAPLVALFSPGCDCSLNGLASAFARSDPSVAGFSLVWSAVAGPAALAATHVALGDHLVAARLAGAAVASSLTALGWRMTPIRLTVCDRAHGDDSASRHLGTSLSALALTAVIGASAVTFVPGMLAHLTNVPAAAIAGALLSPCSTADAVLARVLIRGSAAQAAFVVAAQSFDVRQLAMLGRHFGFARAAVAAFAGCAGCFVAALVAR
jgi:uncharacterized membrane protein YraQ (UPF0718 family)